MVRISFRPIEFNILSYRSFNELREYCGANDANLDEVKRLIQKVNADLEHEGCKYYIRKAPPSTKDADYLLVKRKYGNN